MARQYLRLGDKEIPVTDEESRLLSSHRFEPKKVAEIKTRIFANARRSKTGGAKEAVVLQAVPAS
ncbi:MAG: hypothetical protein COV91_05415 [Candidatus Taylorbacteria bacterium CG11_big_fil_rev_8_21_14_0_20_46_11]|uniref:Uncharacterized protein n=1 Tax=Candidatus Taylorbacteria bacterium CG11_big_fil_rev_8_21_14_0_20_46_11 TaxID=1975025 RepID=A0A2H0KAB1_9BACT|nr:MAG: hypothetical protein COV91_05415 [Candidatus Taylorbacteria bacterium CG11_big_fil_rev_8_21_14_0_20_46_11]